VSRRLRLLALTTALGLAGAALLVFLLAALSRPSLRHRADLSRLGNSGLDPRARAALCALPEGSRITAFLFPENPAWTWNGSAVYPRAFTRLRALLEDARVACGGSLEVVVLDASSPLAAVERERNRLGREVGEVLFLEAGDGDARRVLRFEDLFQVAEPKPDGTPARLHAERVAAALERAAKRLGAGRLPRVAVVQGSGQRSLDDPTGLAGLAGLFADEGLEVVAVSGPRDAEDCDLLFVPGQPRPFLPEDLAALDAWLDSGRPLFLALGSYAPDPVVAAWRERLERRGIRIGDGLVCAPVRTLAGVIEGDPICARLEIRPEQVDDQHPATRRLSVARRTWLLALCRPVETGPADPPNDWSRSRLVRSPAEAWVDRPGGRPFTPDPDERRGIRGLAVAAEPWSPDPDGGNGRVVVLGSAASLDAEALPFAYDLVASALRWLLGGEVQDYELVATRELPFRPDQRLQARLDAFSVTLLPLLPLLAAGWLAWRRRRP